MLLSAPRQLGGPLDVFTKVGRGAARGAKAVGRGAYKAGKYTAERPFVGVRFRGKGWATRLGQRLMAINPVMGPQALLCVTDRYRNTRMCRVTGKVGWWGVKRLVERVYGLPDGTLDEVENALNQAGRDPKKQAAAVKKLPPDVAGLLVTKTAPPTWWEKLLDALGLR